MAAAVLALSLCACSDSDAYINVVPKESTLLVRTDTAALRGMTSGIDASADVYFFEDQTGTFGLCARVHDTKALEKSLKDKGVGIQQRQGYSFATLDGWLLGYSDDAALLMGPVSAAGQSDMTRLMTRCLGQDEDKGVKASPLFARLDTISSPSAMVCRMDALPAQLATPLTIGMPKGAKASDICLEARLSRLDGALVIDGRTYSPSKRIDEALRKADNAFRPITQRYIATMSRDDAAGLFANVDGASFQQLLSQNADLSAMLAGINAAIDLNAIIKSINGDMVLRATGVAQASNDKPQLSMTLAAKVKDADWTADVDYWKQSVPQGGVIGDWGRNCHYYKGGGTSYYFGVTDDLQYMSGDSQASALQSVRPSASPIATSLQQLIVGRRVALLVNLGSLGIGKSESVNNVLTPFLGGTTTLLFVK